MNLYSLTKSFPTEEHALAYWPKGVMREYRKNRSRDNRQYTVVATGKGKMEIPVLQREESTHEFLNFRALRVKRDLAGCY